MTVMHEDNKFNAWCAQHQMHPDKCWEQHVDLPDSRAETPEELNERIAATHVDWQTNGRPKEEDAVN